jgi:iron(III) transport system permease protein
MSNRPALGGLALAVGLLVLVPLAALVGTALDMGPSTLAAGLGSVGGPVLNTVVTGVAGTLVAVVAGSAFAVLTERVDFAGRHLLRVMMLVGLIVPGYVSGIAWLSAYGPAGLTDRALGIQLPGLQGPLGVSLVLGAEAAPLVFLLVAAGLATRAEPDLERAARASGASAWIAFRTISLPLLAPVISGATAIAFVLSVTAFGAPAVLGIPAGFGTMTTRIYRDLSFASDPLAFGRAITLAVLLAVAASAFAALAGWLLAPARAPRSGVPGGPSAAAVPRVGGGRLATAVVAALAWALVVLAVIVPLVALVLTALTRAVGLPPTPDNWTLANFNTVLDTHTWAAFGNSLVLSGLAAAGAVLLAVLGLVAVRGRGRGVAGALVGLSFAIPGSTLAAAVLIAYGPLLRDTLVIILVAYLAKFWVLAFRPLSAALEALAADFSRAARSSGADALTAARTVILPLLWPSLAASAVLVFMFALHELTMSSLLYGPTSATIAVVVLNLQQLGDPTQTAALAVLVTLLVALVSLPLAGRLSAFASARWRG